MAWLTGSKYRKSIPVTGRTVKFTVYPGAGEDAPGVVYLNSKANYFPNDIVFTSADGQTILPHFHSPGTNSFYVKVASELGSTTVYIYYGLVAGDTGKADPIAYDATMHFQHQSVSAPAIAVGAPGAWDDFWISVHSVAKSGDVYYAFYHGARADMVFQIGLATSEDEGATWVKHVSNPIFTAGDPGAWDDGEVTNPLVWIEDSTWYMLYSGCRAVGSAHMGLATSTGPTGWVRSVSNPVLLAGGAGQWDELLIGVGTSILKEADTYYMFYSGFTNGADYATYKIGYAYSADLISWTKYASNPVLAGTPATWKKGVIDPHVRKFGSTYYMWFQGNETTPDRSRIGLATSTDRNIWTALDYPLCESESGSAWDSYWHETPKLVDFGDHWKLLYGGSQGAADPARMQEGMTAYIILGDPENTFSVYDHFDRSNGIDAAKWANDGSYEQDYGAAKKYAANTSLTYILKSLADVAYPLSIHARVKVGSDWLNEFGTHFDISWDNGWAQSGYIAFHHSGSGYDRWGIQRLPGGASDLVSGAIAADTFYLLEIRIDAAGQQLYVDGSLKAAIATAPPQASTRVEAITGRPSSGSAFTTYFDYLFARAWDPTEAVGTPGAEEQPAGFSVLNRLRRQRRAA